MVRYFLILYLMFIWISCTSKQESSSMDPVNWSSRSIPVSRLDTLSGGATYLSVYSQIYSQSEHRSQDLTATVSMRNTSRTDSVFVARAAYYDTHGRLIHSYFEQPIFIAPLETVEIVIEESDNAGGTGGNFMFDWKTGPGVSEPYFECVMISTSGQQGLSFSTRGVKVD